MFFFVILFLSGFVLGGLFLGGSDRWICSRCMFVSVGLFLCGFVFGVFVLGVVFSLCGVFLC